LSGERDAGGMAARVDCETVDLHVYFDGSLGLIFPNTEAGHAWITDNLQPGMTWAGGRWSSTATWARSSRLRVRRGWRSRAPGTRPWNSEHCSGCTHARPTSLAIRR
jgi:hypothetical protein